MVRTNAHRDDVVRTNNVDGFVFRKKASKKSKRKAAETTTAGASTAATSVAGRAGGLVPIAFAGAVQQQKVKRALPESSTAISEHAGLSLRSAAPGAFATSSSEHATSGSQSKKARTSSYRSTAFLEESRVAAAVPRHPVVNPQPRIRNVDHADAVAAVCQLAKNLVECEENAMKRQYVGMNAYISDWSSACCSEFLGAVERRMTDTRSELLAPSIVVLQNPENLRLRAQRDQLEQLLTRLQDELAMWKTQIEASNKLEAERVAEGNAQRDDQGQNEDVLGSSNTGKTPLERMSSKIMRMAVQVEQIQHALEQSKRSVIAAETKRIQLSAQVHEVAQFSVKRPADLIRGLLRQ